MCEEVYCARYYTKVLGCCWFTVEFHCLVYGSQELECLYELFIASIMIVYIVCLYSAVHLDVAKGFPLVTTYSAQPGKGFTGEAGQAHRMCTKSRRKPFARGGGLFYYNWLGRKCR